MNTVKSGSRRHFAKALAVAALAAFGCVAPVHAQTYPAKPVTLVVPYPAGGANDMLGRLIGQKLSEALGQQFIIDNRPGAGTLIGANLVAKAAPDGYTLLVGGFASNAVSPILFKADYDPLTAFESIGLFGTAPIVVITYPNSKYKSLKDIVDAGKAKPGEVMGDVGCRID